LTSVVDVEIAKLWKNGTIAKLQKKWFNVDFSKVPVSQAVLVTYA